jgi:hypothetical protein
MSGQRQKTQNSLALEPKGGGETLAGGYEGTEPPMAYEQARCNDPRSARGHSFEPLNWRKVFE